MQIETRGKGGTVYLGADRGIFTLTQNQGKSHMVRTQAESMELHRITSKDEVMNMKTLNQTIDTKIEIVLQNTTVRRGTTQQGCIQGESAEMLIIMIMVIPMIIMIIHIIIIMIGTIIMQTMVIKNMDRLGAEKDLIEVTM